MIRMQPISLLKLFLLYHCKLHQKLRAYCPNMHIVLQGQCLASNNFGIASETFILDVISPNHQVKAEVSYIFVQILQEFRSHCFFWSEKIDGPTNSSRILNKKVADCSLILSKAGYFSEQNSSIICVHGKIQTRGIWQQNS